MGLLDHTSSILNKIGLHPIEMGGFRLDEVFCSIMASQAIENKTTMYYKSWYGFLIGNIDKIIESEFPNIFKLIETQDFSLYLTDHSIISCGAGGPGEQWKTESEGEDVSTSISIMSDSSEEMGKFKELANKIISPSKDNTIFALANGYNGLRLMPIGSVKSPLIRENYESSVVKSYDYIVKTFNSKEPNGRLVIANGPPGVGKTYLVKGLINDLSECVCVIIPAKLVSELDGPSLIPLFVRHRKSGNKPIVLIIEDADACLVPRETDNISSISTLLNNTDGILGAVLDLRVVATTNQESISFDKALLRPGRLCKRLDIKNLPVSKSNEVYKRLTNSEKNIYKYTDKGLALAQVYADALGVEAVDEKGKKSLGFV